MSKLAREAGRRIMAVALSFAMVMSSNVMVYASGQSGDLEPQAKETAITKEAESTDAAADAVESAEDAEAAEKPEEKTEPVKETAEIADTQQQTKDENVSEETSTAQDTKEEIKEEETKEETASETESSLNDEKNDETEQKDTDVRAEDDALKIDVWDFGGKKEEDAKYRNNITAALWDSCGEVSSGTFPAAATVTFGDLTFNADKNDRLWAAGSTKTNTGDLPTIGTNAYSDGYTSTGGWYCNGAGTSAKRYVEIANVMPGERIDVYTGPHNGTIAYEYKGGTPEETASLGSHTSAQKLSIVAKTSGTYKIYQNGGGGKPFYSRVQKTPAVNVSGTIDFASLANTEGVTLKFVNNETDAETAAELSGTSFTAKLAAGYAYTAVLSGAKGYGISAATKQMSTTYDEALSGKSGVNLAVATKQTYVYSGNIAGFAEGYDISKLSVTMKADPASNSEDVRLTINSKAFSADLEADVEYTITFEGVNDYEITSEKTIKKAQDYAADITVAPKALRSVTGKFVDLKGNQITGGKVSALSFKNAEDDYTYTAAVADNAYTVSLRKGAYSAEITAEGYTTHTHVVVEESAVSKDLLLVSTAADGPLTRIADLYVGDSSKGEANYATVTEAVKAAKRMNPASEEQRITIHIAPGVYREQITVDTPYITFKNDDPSKEVKLTWYYGIGYAYYSAGNTGYYDAERAYDKYEKKNAGRWGCTVRTTSKAEGFRAENIVFENSFNRYMTQEEIDDGVELRAAEASSLITFNRTALTTDADVQGKAATERAAAIVIESDRSEFTNCGFYSSQDTLYTQGAHTYFKGCIIEGQTDYIFGQGNAVFDACELSWKGYKGATQGGYITAVKPAVDTEKGFLFRNCSVTAGKNLDVVAGYFGRPWGPKAKVTFINTKLADKTLIEAAGWTDWKNGDGSAAAAGYYEYNTTTMAGEAVDTSQRVRGVMAAEEAALVKAEDYFGDWTPAYYKAEAETLAFATAPFMTSNGDINTPYPGNKLTISYSLGGNDASDVSVIKWYRVKDGAETLLKTSNATVDKTYKITAEDTGSYIKAVVTPVLISGKTAEAASFTMKEAVREGYEDPENPGADPSLGDGINIFLVGDSTVKDYSANGINSGGKLRDEGSWGEFLQSFFDSEKVKVVNYANGGRSTINFINEGSLDKAAAKMGKGDYMFIQFGHNDCANEYPDRYVPIGAADASGKYPADAGTKGGDGKYTGGTFKWYLLQYVETAKAKGAIPVLITPVSRMQYNADGTIKAHHDDNTTTDNAYVTAVRQLAEEEKVLLIDGFELTKALFEEAYKAGGNDTYGRQIMHKDDKTHNNKLGGVIEAAAVAAAIQKLDINISKTVKAPSKVAGVTTDGKKAFEIDKDGKLTAYNILADYAEKASYWEEAGQKMLDAIKSAVPPEAPNPDNPNPDKPNPEKPGDEAGSTEESKITVSTGDSAISVDDATKIKVEAANLVETGKVCYVVMVTYTYEKNTADGKSVKYQQQLTEGVHYKVSFVTGSNGKSAGEQKINITGTNDKTDLGTFNGKKQIVYTIKSKDDAKNDKAHDISKAAIVLEYKSAPFTGRYLTPGVTVSDSEIKDTDYTVVYKNNVNVGKASVTVVGKGSYYGTKTLNFNIVKADLSKQTVTIEADNATIPPGGKTRTAAEKAKGDFDYKGKAVTFEKLKVKLGDVELSPRSDYTVTYKKNDQAGTAAATIKGTNNLSGAINITYTITAASDAANKLGQHNTDATALPAEYSSKGARLTKIDLGDGIILKEGADYKVNYKGCKKADEITVGTTVETVTITGAGSYKNKFVNTEVKIKAGQGSYHIKDGITVDSAKIFDKTGKIDYAKVISAAKITDAAGVKVKAADVMKIDTENTKITVTPNEANAAKYKTTDLPCHVAAKLSGVKPEETTAKLPDQKFDGVNAVTFTEEDIVNAKVLKGVKATDIRIVSYKNNNKVGTAMVTVEGRPESAFYGTKSLNFKIITEKPVYGESGPEESESGSENSSVPSSEPGSEPSSVPSSEAGSEPSSVPSSEPGTESENPPEEAQKTLWLVGDSTVCSYIKADGKHEDGATYYPRYGYGTQIENYETGYYTVKNLALSGRSSKSFLSEANYTTLKDGISSGDVLIIGFGHNDEKNDDAARYTDPKGDYQTEGSFAKSLYDNYVKLAKDKGAQPILCTPIVRRNKDADTLTASQCHITSDGDYAEAIRKLGKDVSAPVVDLTKLTKEYYEKIGKAETLYLHAWGNSKETSVDDTHLNLYGAKVVAHMLAAEIRKIDIEAAKHIANIKKAPTKEADLAVNPDYKESTYAPPQEDSALWEKYGIFKASAFGDIGGNPAAANFTFGADADKNMHIKVSGNKGKIAGTADGIAMYYYQIPATSTFTLSAKAKVNAVDANAQVAFGLMARDDMYIDKNDKTISSDYVAAGTFGSGSVNSFYRKGGAVTKGPALEGGNVQAGQTYNLSISRPSTDGYVCTFGDGAPQSGGYDFTLKTIDTEYQYIGMFVSRNADITFSDIQLTVDGETVDLQLPQ